MAKKIISSILAVVLICSLIANVYLFLKVGKSKSDDIWNLNFPDANSRDTYYTIHNLEGVQQISKGEGVKVGILDWGFGFSEHKALYAGGRDFTTYQYHDENFNHTNEHGLWMAQVLKEIAPDAEVYALGTYSPDSENEWVDAMIEAIDWSIDNKIDILTLSHAAISKKNRERFDKAVDKAIHQGIVTTFIHYDNPNNILPWGIWNDTDTSCNRKEDINIFQYDYNTCFTESYENIVENTEFDSIYKDELFLSVSSMSVVSAGFVAILKSIDDTLTPDQYKKILIDTSRPLTYKNDSAKHVVDINAAVNYLLEQKRKA